jgi:nucleotide-binding universal stress UspA family protein
MRCETFVVIWFWSSRAPKPAVLMKRFQRILVPLSFSDADTAVIAMVSHIAKWSEPEELIFCHFNPKIEIPAALRETHPWLLEPIDQAAIKRMEAMVTAQTDLSESIRISYHVEEANAVHRSLSLVLEKDCDLVVTGGDKPEIAIRLARKAPCSVCVVPANTPTDVRKLMVAVDFSEYSRYASEFGIALANASHGDLPVLMHLSQIHRGYKWGTFSEDEFVASNDSHAKVMMREFCLTLEKSEESYTTAVHHHESVPFGILEYVRENEIDCIVAGCRGRDALSAMLLGSDVEQIMAHSPVPVFAVKAKGTGRSFLESLLGMND